MNFISWEFVWFFPLILLILYRMPQRGRWIWLLFTSCMFYFYWNQWTIFIMFANIFVTYVMGIVLDYVESRKLRRFCLAVTILFCVGLVVALRILGIPPVGLSFYTFQTMAYVIDIYRKDTQPEKNFGQYVLFISFFPQLVAGPIERSSHLLPQLHNLKGASSNGEIVQGFLQILRGFFKKILIADYFCKYVDKVYGNTSGANGPAAVLATILFALQIYCDFSGYSDIAVGAAKMMGIHLMDNFKQPYLATSIREFWRRWHISLTKWFTDYLYIPLGGNRKGAVRSYANILLVFLCSGLWHGISLNFLLWGGLHGVYLVTGRFLERSNKRERACGEPKGKWLVILKRFRTFALVCFAWIFFRAPNMQDAVNLISSLCKDWSVAGVRYMMDWLELDWQFLFRSICAVGCLFMVSSHNLLTIQQGNNQKHTQQKDDWVLQILFLSMVLIIMIALGWLSLLRTHAESSFIYFQF